MLPNRKQQEILMGKNVTFYVNGELHYGKVVSLEKEIANIKGIEQSKYEHPAYHCPYKELTII